MFGDYGQICTGNVLNLGNLDTLQVKAQSPWMARLRRFHNINKQKDIFSKTSLYMDNAKWHPLELRPTASNFGLIIWLKQNQWVVLVFAGLLITVVIAIGIIIVKVHCLKMGLKTLKYAINIRLKRRTTNGNDI